MDKTFGDTPAAAWYGDVLNNALRELPRGRSSVDMPLLVAMCKAEPKCAQITLQLLAAELKTQLHGMPVSDAAAEAQTTRLLIGAIFLAYCVSRDAVAELPEELAFIIRLNPLILECANFVSADNVRRQSQVQDQGRRSWWRFWSKR